MTQYFIAFAIFISSSISHAQNLATEQDLEVCDVQTETVILLADNYAFFVKDKSQRTSVRPCQQLIRQLHELEDGDALDYISVKFTQIIFVYNNRDLVNRISGFGMGQGFQMSATVQLPMGVRPVYEREEFFFNRGN